MRNQIVSVALGAAILCAATLAAGTASPATSPSAVPSTAASGSPAALTIHTKDFAYKPLVIFVSAGTEVTFVNDDDVAHSVTAADKSFDSGNMDKGARWSYVFKKPGTYAYFCIYHAFMKATVVVNDKPTPSPSAS